MFKPPYFVWVLSALFIFNSRLLQAETMQHEDRLTVDNSLTLHSLIEQALPHYPSSQLLSAKKQALEAHQIQANSLLPGSAAIILRNQNDQLLSRNGETEWEAGVELPIWLSGQRNARAAIATVSEKNIHADTQNMRLQLTGMVRDALWDIQLMQGLADIAQSKHTSANQLQIDIEKRVKLGDLAQQDALIAQTETLQAESELINAKAEVQHAQFRYSNLTALNTMPADFTEKQSTKSELDDAHPALQEANGLIELSVERRNLAQIETRDNPTLTLGTRSLRGASDAEYNNSIGVTLKIPLQAEARNAPLRAAAEMQYSESHVNLSRLKLLLAAAMHEAEHNLEIGVLQLEVLTKQNAIAEQSLTIARKAFQLGELDLSDLIRIQTQAFNAARALKNQQIQQLWNIARYNQAVGELP